MGVSRIRDVDVNERWAPYDIPEAVVARLPDCFFPALAGELFGVFGPKIVLTSEVVGTHGWDEAMRATCNKLGAEWLMEYYDGLPWYHQDMFNGVFGIRVEAAIESADDWGNEYYEHLLGKNVAVDNRRYNAEHSGE